MTEKVLSRTSPSVVLKRRVRLHLSDRGSTRSSRPTIGPPNVAIADPAVPRPATGPCTVELFPLELFGPADETILTSSFATAVPKQPSKRKQRHRWAEHRALRNGEFMCPLPAIGLSFGMQEDRLR